MGPYAGKSVAHLKECVIVEPEDVSWERLLVYQPVEEPDQACEGHPQQQRYTAFCCILEVVSMYGVSCQYCQEQDENKEELR